jgi:flagellar assembly factor FliW
MPVFESPYLGRIEYPEEHVLRFSAGLPAFEDQTRFLAVERTETAPVVYLHSLDRADLVFLTLPAGVVDRNYALILDEGDRAALELGAAEDEVVALVILTVREGSVTANLMAPVVVNRRTRRGAQVIQSGSAYSHRHPLEMPAGGVKGC